jgi:hypothetical protein
MVLSRKTRNRRNYMPKKQYGGFAKSKDAHSVNPMKQYGGSPASQILMNDATMNPPVMNDYITSPRIRESWSNDSLSSLEPKCGGQSGGSIASDLVNEQLNQKAETKPYDAPWSPKGDMNSLNLYETTGGSRRSRSRSRSRSSKNKSNKSNKSKGKSKNRKSKRRNNNKRNNSRRTMRGGGSDWISSQYSLGPSNNPEQNSSLVAQFSQSTATPRSEYMNPSTMGLAGSGYPMGSLEGANVQHIGAPLV